MNNITLILAISLQILSLIFILVISSIIKSWNSCHRMNIKEYQPELYNTFIVFVGIFIASTTITLIEIAKRILI